MHHLSPFPRRARGITLYRMGCQEQVRFFALLRIKPHAPPLVRVPVNSFEFHSCERTPQVEYLLRLRRHRVAMLPNISRHELTTTMHHLSLRPRRESTLHALSSRCQDLVRFFALLRIKPHAPPLVRVPVNSFEFHSCERTPQVDYLLRLRRHRRTMSPNT